MTSRRDFLRGCLGLSAIIASGESPAIVRSMVAARQSIAAGRLLPYLKRVEYIESTGTQWIAPDCIFKPSSRLMIDFSFTRARNQQRIIGYNQSNGKARIDLYNSMSAAKVSYDFGNHQSSGNVTFTDYTTERIRFDLNEKTKVINYSVGAAAYRVSVSSKSILTQTDTEPNFTIGYCITTDGTPSSNSKPYAKFYGFRFWEDADGVLVRDLIPVIDLNGEAKMFDRVTQSYPDHYGTFVAGPATT